ESGSNIRPGSRAEDKIELNKDKIVQLYRRGKFLLQHTAEMVKWICRVLSHIRLNEFRWQTSVGVWDAAHTAMAGGAIWAIKYTLLGYFTQYVRLQTRPLITVAPQFNNTQFSTDLSCIGQIRMGYAIWAGLVFIVRIMQAKGGFKAWQSILFKA